jgi:hypothetical protein
MVPTLYPTSPCSAALDLSTVSQLKTINTSEEKDLICVNLPYLPITAYTPFYDFQHIFSLHKNGGDGPERIWGIYRGKGSSRAGTLHTTYIH